MSQAYEVAFNDENGFDIKWTNFIAYNWCFSQGPWNPRPVCTREHVRKLDLLRLVYCRERELGMQKVYRVGAWPGIHENTYYRRLESERMKCNLKSN